MHYLLVTFYKAIMSNLIIKNLSNLHKILCSNLIGIDISEKITFCGVQAIY